MCSSGKEKVRNVSEKNGSSNFCHKTPEGSGEHKPHFAGRVVGRIKRGGLRPKRQRDIEATITKFSSYNMAAWQRRLQKELLEIKKKPPPGMHLDSDSVSSNVAT